MITPADHAAKVAAIKATSPDVFVNARVETYWLNKDRTISQTIDRALAYVDAGADGIFIPGAADPSDLDQLTGTIPAPVNVLVIPGLSLPQLGELGVRRVSTGSLPYRVAIDAAVRVAEAVRDNADVPSATPYPDAQDEPAPDRSSRPAADRYGGPGGHHGPRTPEQRPAGG